MNIRICSALCVFLCIPFVIHAGPITRSGEEITVDGGQVLESDFYAFGKSVIISGSAKDDVSVIGFSVLVHGGVKSDLTILAGSAQVLGDIGDDLRVIAGEVIVSGYVQGDVVVTGGTLKLLSTAIVDGDVLFMGGELQIDGIVKGSIYGTSDTARIDADVQGDVTYEAARSLTLGDSARIGGSVTYSSAQDIVRAQNAQVEGKVHAKSMTTSVSESGWSDILFEIVSIVFTALVGYMLFRRHIEDMLIDIRTHVGVSGGIGLLAVIVAPFLIALFGVSGIGIPIALMVLLLYCFLLIAGVIIASCFIGYVCAKIVYNRYVQNPLTVSMGAIILFLILNIPKVGLFVFLALHVIGVGGIVRSLMGTILKRQR
jgi:cytoskeletal protein CcmA (bactofilin family)